MIIMNLIELCQQLTLSFNVWIMGSLNLIALFNICDIITSINYKLVDEKEQACSL